MAAAGCALGAMLGLTVHMRVLRGGLSPVASNPGLALIPLQPSPISGWSRSRIRFTAPGSAPSRRTELFSRAGRVVHGGGRSPRSVMARAPGFRWSANSAAP